MLRWILRPTLLLLPVALGAPGGCDSVSRRDPADEEHHGGAPGDHIAQPDGGVGGDDAGGAAAGGAGGGGAGGQGVCPPGDTTPCYGGPAATQDVGICHGGTATCQADGLAWGPCEGEVLPGPGLCDLDGDCDGFVDAAGDCDGDGWTSADGDCCEDLACAPEPGKVNPGALEIVANGVDDDCDPATADAAPPPSCEGLPLSAPTTCIELVKAMDLCQFTSNAVPLSQKKWGVVQMALLQADGMPPEPNDVQRGVLSSYGVVSPVMGSVMAALSSGAARSLGDPGAAQPQDGPMPGQLGGYDAGTASGLPPAYVAPYGGALPPPASGCAACNDPGCATVHDSVDMRLQIRAPTNVSHFTVAYDYYTSEYPERSCGLHDDRFVLLDDAPGLALPLDTNVVFDLLGRPVSVNDALFGVCAPQGAAFPDPCWLGPGELVGTGMGGWNGAVDSGAATGWLTAEVPVAPGETFTLDFVLYDAGDHGGDSLVLVDAFTWVP